MKFFVTGGKFPATGKNFLQQKFACYTKSLLHEKMSNMDDNFLIWENIALSQEENALQQEQNFLSQEQNS